MTDQEKRTVDELRDCMYLALTSPGIIMSVPAWSVDNQLGLREINRHVNDILDELLRDQHVTPYVLRLTSGQITLDEFRTFLAERYAFLNYEQVLNCRKRRVRDIINSSIPCRNYY